MVAPVSVGSRVHRTVGAIAGLFVGANAVMLGYFVDLLLIGTVAGLATFVATVFLVPSLIHAARTGGFPPVDAGSVAGTALNPGALGVALALGGPATLFGGFVFGTSPLAVLSGAGVTVALYLLLDRVAPQTPRTAPASGDPTADDDRTDGQTDTDDDDGSRTLVSALGVLAGIVLVNALGVMSESLPAGLVLTGVAVLLVGVGVYRRPG